MTDFGGTYSTGRVVAVNGSVAVAGEGALWTDILEGDWLVLNGGVIGIVEAVDSLFEDLTLKTPWPGTSTAVGPTALTSISNASPAIFTLANHGLFLNDTITLTTTGALPTGLAIATTYWVTPVTSSTFKVSATQGGAFINTSSAGSGTHSFTRTGSGYQLLKMSWLRYEPALTQAKTRELLAQMEEVGNFVFVSTPPPDPELGEDGQFALYVGSVPWRVWQKAGGVWTEQAWGGVERRSMVNRLINGNMLVDQANESAAVTVNTLGPHHGPDMWRCYGTASAGVFTMQRVAGVAADRVAMGQTFYTRLTTTTASASPGAGALHLFANYLEGYSIADFLWGTSGARAITLSFWVRSSLTGTFGGSLTNASQTRSYPFTFTISAANTWEYKTITIPGDVTGTWPTTVSVALALYFDVGCGSNSLGTANAWVGALRFGVTGTTRLISTLSATMDFTAVQMEVGETATPYAERPFGEELALCQRYFQKSYTAGTAIATATQAGAYFYYFQLSSPYTVTDAGGCVIFPVSMRTVPTITLRSIGNGAAGFMFDLANGVNAAMNSGNASTTGFGWFGALAAPNRMCNVQGHWIADARM